MAAQAQKKTLSSVLADARLKVESGPNWPLLVTILPRVGPPQQALPCGFCGASTHPTPYGRLCPACETEERTQ